MLRHAIATKAVSLGLKRPPEKENVLEQGLPAVGTARDLTRTAGFLYSLTRFLMMKAMNYEIGTEVSSGGVCQIQTQYFGKLQEQVKGITCPGVGQYLSDYSV